MSLDSWKLLQTKQVFSAAPWLTVHCDTAELPGGRVVDDFYRVVLPDFAVVVPLTDANEMVMVRGYKHGLGRVSISAPAGYVDPGESSLEAAKRELLEETGYAASEWHELECFIVDGNRHCGVAHLYVARHATKGAAAAKPILMRSSNSRWSVRSASLTWSALGDVALLPAVSAVCLALLFDKYGSDKSRDLATT